MPAALHEHHWWWLLEIQRLASQSYGCIQRTVPLLRRTLILIFVVTLSLWPSRWCGVVSAAVINGSVARLETEAAIQQAIMTAGPVQAAFSVWSDFMQYKTGATPTQDVLLHSSAAEPLQLWFATDD